MFLEIGEEHPGQLTSTKSSSLFCTSSDPRLHHGFNIQVCTGPRYGWLANHFTRFDDPMRYLHQYFLRESAGIKSIEDDGEYGGESVGRVVWEWFETHLKMWEAKEKETSPGGSETSS